MSHRNRFHNFGRRDAYQTFHLQVESRMPALSLVRAVKLEDYPLAKFCRYEIPRGRIRLLSQSKWQ